MNYIGFDLGDGESSVALLKEGSRNASIIIVDGRESFPTAVGTLKETHAHIIGNNAIANESICDDFRVCFKQHFADADMDVFNCYQRFISVVLHILRNKISEKISNAAEFRFVIGHPAGWNDTLKKRYEGMLNACHIGSPMLVSESRAALVQYASTYLLGNSGREKFEMSVLICDFGSSTIDFSYLPNGITDDIRSLGHKNLGGGLIDKQIVINSIKRYADSKDRDRILSVLDSDKSLLSLLLIKARDLKEKYFKTNEKNAEFSRDVTIQRYGIEFINITVNDSIMESSLNTPIHECNDESLKYALDSVLNEVCEKLKNDPIDKIVLTGGASRMRFFQEMCENKFSVPVHLSSSPETDIAKGLALDGEYKFRIDCLKNDIMAFIGSDVMDAMVSNGMMPFYAELSSAIINDMTGSNDGDSGILRHAMGKWVENGKTIRDLANAFDSAATEYLDTSHFKDLLREHLLSWAKSGILPKIQAELNSLCRKNRLSPNKAKIKEIQLTDKISLKNVKLVYIRGEFGPITLILSLLGLTYDLPIPKPIRKFKSEDAFIEKYLDRMKEKLNDYLVSEKHFAQSVKSMLIDCLKECIHELETEIRI